MSLEKVEEASVSEAINICKKLLPVRLVQVVCTQPVQVLEDQVEDFAFDPISIKEHHERSYNESEKNSLLLLRNREYGEDLNFLCTNEESTAVSPGTLSFPRMVLTG